MGSLDSCRLEASNSVESRDSLSRGLLHKAKQRIHSEERSAKAPLEEN